MPTKLIYTTKGNPKQNTETFRCKSDALDFIAKMQSSPIKIDRFEIKEG